MPPSIENAEKHLESTPCHPQTPALGNLPEDPHTPTTTPTQGRWARLIHALAWTPPWCRWDEQSPPKFGLPLNFLFAFAGTFTVGNKKMHTSSLPHDIFQGHVEYGMADTDKTYNRSPIYTIHIRFWMNWLNSSTFHKKEPPSSPPVARPDMP